MAVDITRLYSGDADALIETEAYANVLGVADSQWSGIINIPGGGFVDVGDYIAAFESGQRVYVGNGLQQYVVDVNIPTAPFVTDSPVGSSILSVRKPTVATPPMLITMPSTVQTFPETDPLYDSGDSDTVYADGGWQNYMPFVPSMFYIAHDGNFSTYYLGKLKRDGLGVVTYDTYKSMPTFSELDGGPKYLYYRSDIKRLYVFADGASYGETPTYGKFAYSDDEGDTWVPATYSSYAMDGAGYVQLRNMFFTGSAFIGHNNNGVFYTSTDAFTWTEVTTNRPATAFISGAIPNGVGAGHPFVVRYTGDAYYGVGPAGYTLLASNTLQPASADFFGLGYCCPTEHGYASKIDWTGTSWRMRGLVTNTIKSTMTNWQGAFEPAGGCALYQVSANTLFYTYYYQTIKYLYFSNDGGLSWSMAVQPSTANAYTGWNVSVAGGFVSFPLGTVGQAYGGVIRMFQPDFSSYQDVTLPAGKYVLYNNGYSRPVCGSFD